MTQKEFEAELQANCGHKKILLHYENLMQKAPTHYECGDCAKEWTPKEFAIARNEKDWYFKSEVVRNG